MAKFNVKPGVQGLRNHEGVRSYGTSPEMELYATVATGALQNKFYETENETLTRIRDLLTRVRPEFAAKLAVYAREKMYMRSVPLVVLVELLRNPAARPLIRKLTARVIQRADELSEVMAYFQQSQGRAEKKKLGKLPVQFRKGLADAFGKFDAYQLGKYDREGVVRLRDVMFLTHPKPEGPARVAFYKQLAEDTLPIPYTWETELSKLGEQSYADEASKAAAFKAKWEELLDSGNLGYMALLRNLRNIAQAKVSLVHIDNLCNRLTNPQEVARSKQFPFRFFSAYREMQEGSWATTSMAVPQIMDALEEAIIQSVQNIPFNDTESTVIACDVSSSMQTPISAKSKVERFHVGLTLGMLMHFKSKRSIAGIFGDRWKVIAVPGKQVIRNVMDFSSREGEVGASTNGYKVLDYLTANNIPTDRVMMFTDNQMWNSSGTRANMVTSWVAYKAICPQARLYLFDLAGYGKGTPVRLEAGNVALIAGWSDKIFNVLDALERGEDAVAEVEQMEL